MSTADERTSDKIRLESQRQRNTWTPHSVIVLTLLLFQLWSDKGYESFGSLPVTDSSTSSLGLHQDVDNSTQVDTSTRSESFYTEESHMSGDNQANSLSNILYTSASEALICTCPPGSCRAHGKCCSSCPGAQDVCEEKPLLTITGSINNVNSQIRAECCSTSGHCSTPVSCPKIHG